MFAEKVFSGKNDIGRWIALIMIVMGAIYFIGLIPSRIAIFLKMNDNPDLMSDTDQNFDLSHYDLSSITEVTLTFFPFIVGLLALLLLIKPVHERQAISLITGNLSFRWKRFLLASFIWFILIAIYTVITTGGFQKIHIQYQFPDFIKLIVVSSILLSVKAIFEETFFRGYLLQGFTRLFLTRWMPVLVTAILFTFFQNFYPDATTFDLTTRIPQYLLFGLFLGICTVMDDGLEVALGVQTINNIFLSVFTFQQSNTISAPDLFRINDKYFIIHFIGFVLILSLFLQVAKNKFSWPQWSYLFSKVEVPIADEIDYNEQYEFPEEYED